jgi:hypothetical protein
MKYSVHHFPVVFSESALGRFCCEISVCKAWGGQCNRTIYKAVEESGTRVRSARTRCWNTPVGLPAYFFGPEKRYSPTSKFEEFSYISKILHGLEGHQKANISSDEIKKNLKFMDFMYKDLRPNNWDITVYCEICPIVFIFKITNGETLVLPKRLYQCIKLQGLTFFRTIILILLVLRTLQLALSAHILSSAYSRTRRWIFFFFSLSGIR